MLFEPMHEGYGAVVLAGENYSLNGTWDGDVVFEFSDMRIAGYFDAEEDVFLNVSGWTCELKHSSDRHFVGALGLAKGEERLPATCRYPHRAVQAAPEVTTTTTPGLPGACEP